MHTPLFAVYLLEAGKTVHLPIKELMEKKVVLLIQCIVLCAIFTVLILPPQFKNPLSQIASYPPKIRERVKHLERYKDSLSQTQKRNVARKIAGALIAVIILAAMAYFSEKTRFVPAFIHVIILFLAVNLYDLLILDFIVFPNSKRVVIPGTEDMVSEYRNPMHHIKGALKGVAIGTAVALLAGGLVEGFRYLTIL